MEKAMPMALKDKIPKLALKMPKFGIPKWKLPKLSALLYWQAALGTLILLCLILAISIWLSGKRETRDAFSDGRRLLIRLDNGAIEGKQESAEPTPPAAQAKTETPASAPAQTPEHPAADAAPTAPAVAAESSPPAEAPPAATSKPEGMVELPAPLAAADAGPVLAATVPLAAVNPALSEKADAGMLPSIGNDGTKPWRYYAKPYERKGSLPMIAIIVTGLGQSKAVSESAAKLPENFSLSFSPYAKDIASWVKTARIAGHEVFIDLPLEPANYPATDPGPYGLLTGKGQDNNDAHLQWIMARTQGYTGFVTSQNEAFSSNAELFKALLQALGNRGLMLVVGHEPAKSDTKQALETGTTANITADVLIDEDLSAAAIRARLTSLEQIAKTRGYAIGIASAFPVTMQQLNDWAAKLPEEGFVLVPVTFIVHLRFS